MGVSKKDKEVEGKEQEEEEKRKGRWRRTRSRGNNIVLRIGRSIGSIVKKIACEL